MTSTLTRPAGAPLHPAATHRDARKRKSRFYDRPGWLTYALLGAFFVAAVFPLWWSFVMASRQASDINAVPPVVIPGPNFLSNTLKVFATVDFAKALINSVIISGTIAVSVVFFSTLAGFAFAKLRFRGRNPLMVSVIATMAIPTQLGIIPLFMIVSELRLSNTLAAVIIPGLVSAFGVFFMRQYLVDTIPDELIEAARVDGAGMLRTFWSIVLPISIPSFVVVLIWQFTTAWNDFLFAVFFSNAQNGPVTITLNNLAQGSMLQDYGASMAGALIASFPTLIVYILLGRYFIGGLMAGSVKG